MDTRFVFVRCRSGHCEMALWLARLEPEDLEFGYNQMRVDLVWTHGLCSCVAALGIAKCVYGSLDYRLKI